MKDIDFLPERIKVSRARRRRVTRQAYLLGACVLCLALLAYIRYGRIERTRRELAMLSDRFSTVERQLQCRQGLELERAELLIIQRIQNHLGSRIDALDLMAELEKLLPPAMVLTHMTVESMNVAIQLEPAVQMNMTSRAMPVGANPFLTERKVRRVHLTLTGMAPNDVDVANFIGQLSASDLFEDVSMGYAKTMPFKERIAREFQASCYVIR